LNIVLFFLANAVRKKRPSVSAKWSSNFWSASATAFMTTAIFVGEDAVSRARQLQHVYTLAFVLNMTALVEQLA